MRRSSGRAVPALACVLPLLSTAFVGVVPPAPAIAAEPQPVAALEPAALEPVSVVSGWRPVGDSPGVALLAAPEPAVLPPRLGFTDDSDDMMMESQFGCESAGSSWDCDDPEVLQAGGGHAGEASFTGDKLAYVSDHEDASGEVYVRTRGTSANGILDDWDEPVRVTCDTAAESHPAVSPDATKVAYASNTGGSWSIWVVWHTPEPGGESPPPALGCVDMPRSKVADGPGEDLWPTWLDDDTLAFSRSGEGAPDPLGDLYAAPLGGRGVEVPADAAVRLTDGPAAETQPRAFYTGYFTEGPGEPEEVEQYDIVFTTTQFRSDGSLAGIGSLSTSDLGPREPASVWLGEPLQSTEAVLLDWESTLLGFTTTRDDPFGDVVWTTLGATEVEMAPGSGFFTSASSDSIETIEAEQGSTESHLALFGYSGVDAVYTRRSLDADVADAVASDGSSRRQIAAGTEDAEGQPSLDESTPTYSPDGSLIAYSRTAGDGREIVIANADGSDVRPLLPGRPPDALDFEPAWSPDGTRIAFARSLADDEEDGESDASRIFVAMIETGEASLVSVPPDGTEVWDENPSWSPDGTRLVIARTVVARPELAISIVAPATAMRGEEVTVTVTVVNEGTYASDEPFFALQPGFRLTTEDGRCDQFTWTTTIWCYPGTLSPGAEEAFAFSGTAEPAGPATISTTLYSDGEANYDNNTATVTVEVVEPPDVSVALQMPPDVGYLQEETVVVTVENAEAASRTGTFDLDLVAAPTSEGDSGDLEFSGTGLPTGCALTSDTIVRCTGLGPLDPGANVALSLTVLGTGGGIARVTATVPALPGELQTGNNTASGTTPVESAPPPDVAVTIPGEEITVDGTAVVPVTVTNAGSAPLAAGFTVEITRGEGSGGGWVDFVEDGLPDACSLEDDGESTWVECGVEGLAPGASVLFDIPVVAVRQNQAYMYADVAPLPGEVATSNNQATVPLFIPEGSETPPPSPPIDEPTTPPVIVPTSPPTLVPGPAAITLPVIVPDAVETPMAATPDRAEVAVLPLAVRGLDRGPWAPMPSQLWVLDAATGGGGPLSIPPDPDCPPSLVCTPTPIAGRVPAWSPDGLSVAYEYRGDVRIAALTDADGNAVADRPETVVDTRALTGFGVDGAPLPSRTELSAATDPAWAPDGTEIAVAGQPAGHADQSGIYALRPDGTGLRTIAQGRGPETEPAWQPFADVSVSVTATPTAGLLGFGTVIEVTVRNGGPATVGQATLSVELPAGLEPGETPSGCTLSEGLFTCQVAGLAAGTDRTIAFPVTGTIVGELLATASVSTTVPDRVPTNNSASASVTVTQGQADLEVTVTTTTPGYVGGTGTTSVTVRNAGPQASARASLTLQHPAGLVTVIPDPACLPVDGDTPGACEIGPLPPGGTVTFTWVTSFVAAGQGDVVATVAGTLPDPIGENNRALVSVIVRQPVLRLSPNVMAPNGVTLASGTDFPPGAQVVLTWDVGIMERLEPVTVGPDGTISPRQIVIFRRDQLGPRNLIATATVAGAFAPVEEELLVAPRSVAPPRFVERN